MRRTRVFVAVAGGVGALLYGVGLPTRIAAQGPADACSALTSFALPDGRIRSATPVAPPFAVPWAKGGTVTRPFCRVAGVLTPTPSSEINFEVWLPTEGYAGRFAGVGNGGLAGAIFYGAMGRMVQRGYAVFGSDRGHKGTDMAWSVNQPEKVIDFRERADHLATVASKAVVARFYGAAPRHSYWSGCSAGGVQGYTAAWLHPDDYDGIIAGASPLLFNRDIVPGKPWPTMGDITYIAPILAREPGFTKAKARMVSDAAVAQCDANDGVRDGVIADPKQCRFDPASLVCRPGQTDKCLSPAEAVMLKQAYATGHSRGAEYYWKALSGDTQGGAASPAASAAMTDMVSFMTRSMYVPSARQEYLQGFAARGGKMIAYVGLNDFPMPKMIKYEDALIARHRAGGKSWARAKAEVDRFHRLFLLPGVEHCSGGPGADNILAQRPADQPATGPGQDAISAIEAWVERGQAPARLVAVKYTDGDPAKGMVMSRPLCVYPNQARWNRVGDSSDYRSYTCVAPTARRR
ncbi:tannase/feruloyl esterase family alpha/beta hydrolase [Novosphingobium bradum]|uniref:Tannase/feruloyl esterase family alpha/beta hydrolase n=1 Tax=Novosphingobium bradum TaxID=1737444 RepID=A0ABV7IV53_9SPHN